MKARCVFAGAGLLALAGCAAGPAPRIETPPPALPEAFLYAPEGSAAASLAALLPSDDAAFAALSAQALAGSPTLAEAAARVEQARAGVARTRAERFPEIGAAASVTATRSNPEQFGAALPPGIAIDAEQIAYAANLTARWDPDIFGRLRAQDRAARARLDAADADARAVRLALVAEIAASVIDWRTLEARAQALAADAEAADALARLAGVRERAGIAPGFDRVRAEGAAASSRSRLAGLESERARLLGRMVTLTAQDAAAVQAALALAGGPRGVPAVPASLPSQLLLRRPDVAAAEARLRAADAELAATARRRFPAFGLSGAIGLLAFGLENLFDSESLVGSLAASVAAPLLDFGRLEAEIDGAAAEKKAAFAAYRGAAYRALGDAETAYALVATADRESKSAAAEAADLARAARLAETRQRAGLADFLTVLDARRAADASGERAAAAQGRALRARVLLWQALGGSAAAAGAQ